MCVVVCQWVTVGILCTRLVSVMSCTMIWRASSAPHPPLINPLTNPQPPIHKHTHPQTPTHPHSNSWYGTVTAACSPPAPQRALSCACTACAAWTPCTASAGAPNQVLLLCSFGPSPTLFLFRVLLLCSFTDHKSLVLLTNHLFYSQITCSTHIHQPMTHSTTHDTGTITGMAFTPHGGGVPPLLAVASERGTVHLYRLAAPQRSQAATVAASLLNTVAPSFLAEAVEPQRDCATIR